jgi:hypothetical protein
MSGELVETPGRGCMAISDRRSVFGPGKPRGREHGITIATIRGTGTQKNFDDSGFVLLLTFVPRVGERFLYSTRSDWQISLCRRPPVRSLCAQ